jgi:LPXTG-site transpeptidase (sortase) family protein
MIQIENVHPAIRWVLFIVIVFGSIYGAYYALFHPYSVKVNTAQSDDEVIVTTDDESLIDQQFPTTTNYDRIVNFTSNLARTLRNREQKQNPANYLIIDKIGVSAPLEKVGFDQKGNMATPSGADVAVIYAQGAQIGSIGTVVISGHKEYRSGKAVFTRLNELVAGDSILVTNEKGKGYRYIVESKNNYPIDNFPTKEIFSNTSTARLNLITCSGKFNTATRLYSHRLVVTAILAR